MEADASICRMLRPVIWRESDADYGGSLNPFHCFQCGLLSEIRMNRRRAPGRMNNFVLSGALLDLAGKYTWKIRL